MAKDPFIAWLEGDTEDIDPSALPINQEPLRPVGGPTGDLIRPGETVESARLNAEEISASTQRASTPAGTITLDENPQDRSRIPSSISFSEEERMALENPREENGAPARRVSGGAPGVDTIASMKAEDDEYFEWMKQNDPDAYYGTMRGQKDLGAARKEFRSTLKTEEEKALFDKQMNTLEMDQARRGMEAAQLDAEIEVQRDAIHQWRQSASRRRFERDRLEAWANGNLEGIGLAVSPTEQDSVVAPEIFSLRADADQRGRSGRQARKDLEDVTGDLNPEKKRWMQRKYKAQLDEYDRQMAGEEQQQRVREIGLQLMVDRRSRMEPMAASASWRGFDIAKNNVKTLQDLKIARRDESEMRQEERRNYQAVKDSLSDVESELSDKAKAYRSKNRGISNNDWASWPEKVLNEFMKQEGVSDLITRRESLREQRKMMNTNRLGGFGDPVNSIVDSIKQAIPPGFLSNTQEQDQNAL